MGGIDTTHISSFSGGGEGASPIPYSPEALEKAHARMDSAFETHEVIRTEGMNGTLKTSQVAIVVG